MYYFIYSVLNKKITRDAFASKREILTMITVSTLQLFLCQNFFDVILHFLQNIMEDLENFPARQELV